MLRKSKSGWVALALAACMLGGPRQAAAQTDPSAGRTRIAVVELDTSETIVSATISSHWTMMRRTMGPAITDMLTTALVNNGGYDVYERGLLNHVLQEQGLAANQLVDPATAAQIGKLLGVQKLVIAKMTQFSIETKSQNMIFVKKNLTTCKLALDGRVIDTTSGVIEKACRVDGQANEENWKQAVIEGLDFSRSESFDGLLGRATRQAVDQLAKGLFGVDTQQVAAKVLGIDGQTLVLDAGTNKGVTVGAEVVLFSEQVMRNSQGEPIFVKKTELGRAKVAELQDEACLATGYGQWKEVPQEGASVTISLAPQK